MMSTAIGIPLICASLDIEVEGSGSLFDVSMPTGLSEERAASQRKAIKDKLGRGLLLMPMTGLETTYVLEGLLSLMSTANQHWEVSTSRELRARGGDDSEYRIPMAMQSAKLAWQIIESLPME